MLDAYVGFEYVYRLNWSWIDISILYIDLPNFPVIDFDKNAMIFET